MTSQSYFWVAFGLFVGGILDISFRALAGRMLGVSEFGQLSYLNTLLVMAGTIATLGSGNVVPRYLPIFVANNQDIVGRFISFMLRTTLIGGVVVSIALLAILSGIHLRSEKGIWMILILIPVFALSELSYSVNRGLHQAQVAIIQREIIRRSVPFAVALLSVYFETLKHIEIFILAIGLGLVASIVYGGRRQLWVVHRNPINDLPIKNIIQYAAPLVLSTALMQVNSRIDILIAKANLSPTELGIYTGSLVFPQVLSMLPSVFTFSLLPYAAQYFNEGNMSAISHHFISVTRKLCVIGLMPAGALFIGGGWWLSVIFGKDYSMGKPVIELLALAYFLMATMGAVGVILLACGKSKTYLFSDVIAITCGGGAQWVLSDKYGLMGLVYGVVTTILILVVIRGVATLNLLKLNKIRVHKNDFAFIVLALFFIWILTHFFFASEALSIVLWVLGYAILFLSLYSRYIHEWYLNIWKAS